MTNQTITINGKPRHAAKEMEGENCPACFAKSELENEIADGLVPAESGVQSPSQESKFFADEQRAGTLAGAVLSNPSAAVRVLDPLEVIRIGCTLPESGVKS